MKPTKILAFGPRLRELRKGKGMTQTQLGEMVGLSKRMMAYYEQQDAQPPGGLLAELARALDVSVDELLGTKPVKPRASPKTARLMNRLNKVELLPPADQRAVLKFIDAMLQSRAKRTRARSAA